MTFKQKIASIFFGFILILAGVIFLNLYAYAKIDGHSKQINDAGSLRMRTYKITLFVNQYSLTGNEELKKEAEVEIKNFNGKLSSLKIFYENENQKAILYKLNKISETWGKLEAKLKAGIESPYNNDVMILITKEANELVSDQIHPVVNEMQTYSQHQVRFFKILQAAIFLLCLVLTIIFGVSITGVLSRSVVQLGNLMTNVESGDLTVEGAIYSKDELGILTKSFNNFISKVRVAITEILENSLVLKNSSDELLSIAKNMEMGSGETSQKTNQASKTLEQMSSRISENADSLSLSSKNLSIIAASIEEISGTIKKLSSASEQTSATVNNISELIAAVSQNISNLASSSKDISNSINSIAISSKEFDISLNEISNNCERSRNITQEASSMVKDAGEIITELNSSSKQIGKIINLINDIADQTNMLALNATIEAAGAGEAGKGFAVVANEVKELAKQTSEATFEISEKITYMLRYIENAVNAVTSIKSVIDEISQITITIASAVTEQASISGEISKNVANVADHTEAISKNAETIALSATESSKKLNEASKGVSEIARSVSELYVASNEAAKSTEDTSIRIENLSAASTDISQGISNVTENVKEVKHQMIGNTSEANNTKNNAEELSIVASKLDILVKQFKV